MPITGIGVLLGSSTNLVRSVALAGIQIHVGMDSLISRNHGMIHVALSAGSGGIGSRSELSWQGGAGGQSGNRKFSRCSFDCHGGSFWRMMREGQLNNAMSIVSLSWR